MAEKKSLPLALGLTNIPVIDKLRPVDLFLH
jgi:hypothetical protein